MKNVFISYKSEDFDNALWVKTYLEANGISCWMAPMCIPGGASYAVEIPQAIHNCKAIVVVMSGITQTSKWVPREIDQAINEGKVLMPFMIEECTLKADYGFYFSNVQWYDAYKDRADAAQKMLDDLKVILRVNGVEGLDDIEEVPANTIMAPVAPSKPKNQDSKKIKPLYFIIGGAVLLAIIIALIIILVVPKGDKTEGDGAGNSKPSTTHSADEQEQEKELVLSDKLSDFTFELDGVVYQLPCDYSDFTKNGWTVYNAGYSNDNMLSGMSYEEVEMARDGSKITARFYNLSGNSKKISECKIGMVKAYRSYVSEFKVAKGITVASSTVEIKEAFGAPNDFYNGSSSEKLTYTYGGNSSVVFLVDKETSESGYSYICMENYVKTEDETVTIETRPEYLSSYVAPKALGSDTYSSVFSLEGDLYQLPAPVSAFVDNGWEIVEQPGYIVAGAKDNIYIQKNGERLYLSVVNFADYQTTPLNCAVVRIAIYDDNKVDFKLPSVSTPITMDMSQSALNASLPKDFEYSEDYGTYSAYGKGNKECDITIKLNSEDKSIYHLSLSTDVWNYE